MSGDVSPFDIRDRMTVDAIVDDGRLAALTTWNGLPCQCFLGIPFTKLSFDDVLDLVAERPADSPFAYLSTPNSTLVTFFNQDRPGVAEGLANAWILSCDGRVVRRVASMLFGIWLPLIAGSDFTEELFRKVIKPTDRITIIGGNEALAEALRTKFNLAGVSFYSPPFGFSRDPKELDRCAEFIRENPARFVFLACGAPQSELLGAHMVRTGGATGVGLCIGASLMFVTGQMQRAPRILQDMGLEWLHRLLGEPRRMSRRLIDGQLPFLWLAFRARLSGKITGLQAPRFVRIRPLGASRHS